ncbi:MAG TPA: choice-of-anchor D domain-containing protein [Actinospica sp.]|nr:choice-of-anchor D domain-containing protein [Actinospica sp.]
MVFALLLGGLAAAIPSHADVITVSEDTNRTGWDPNEASLSAGAVSGSDFGQLFSTALTGQIYAQPLVVGSTVIVGTEENHVYGLNSETGAIEWSDYLGPSWPASTIGCGDLTPDIGITSTPVYDPSSGYLYLTAKVNDGADATQPHYYLYAISASTGAVRTGWPVTISGSPSNFPSNTFDTEDEMQRPGLLLENGSVYMAFGSHCDHKPYSGYVVGVNTSTLSEHMWTTEAGTGDSGAGIWQAGGGIVSDGAGGMYVATGNGATPPVGPGTSPPVALSESVVHLGVGSDGTISASDFFSPADATTLDANDQDLASGGPVALPDAEFGTSAYPDLMIVIGKEGRMFLLNRDNLGGRGQGTNGGDAILGQTTLTGVWGHPAVYGGDGGYAYVTESKSHLVALSYGLTGTGKPAFHVAGNSLETFGYTSGSPVVTSNGTNSGSGLVWDVSSNDATGAGGQLMVYNAVPSNGVMTLIRSFPLGNVSKFSVPATNNGRVYVGTRDGNLMAFGAPTTQALQSSSVGFGQVAVGSSETASATLTATRTVTVSAVSASAPFTAGGTTPALPVTLTAGQTLSVPVTFTPKTWGAVTGSIALTTNSGTIDVGVTGTGTQPGLAAQPSTLDWGTRAVGSTETLAVGVTNTGSTTETFSAVTGPGTAFTASGLPNVGDTLAPGVSDTITATYAPTAAETDSSSIVLTSDQGSVTIPLTATAIVADPQVTISPTSFAFGNVPVGSSATQSFTVSNTGNVNLTVTKAAPPTAPFSSGNPIPEGQQLAPGESYTVQLTFAPTAVANYSGTYEVTTDTGQGAMNITMTGSGTPSTTGTAITPPGGGWSLNGAASTSGTNLVLTKLNTNKAASAVYGTAVPSAGLSASFTAQLSGGTGGTGLTFSMLDANKSTANSIGGSAGGMGFSGLSGVAVVLSTYQQAGAPSANFVGVATGGSGGTLTYLATSTNIGALRTGTHTVTVTVSGSTLNVSVDGTLVLSPTVTLPTNVLPAFTGATGGTTDNHIVSGVSISANGTAITAPGGGWSYNGVATMSGAGTLLTPATTNQAGAAIDTTAVPSANFEAGFTSVMTGGTGGDGLTLSLLDASSVSTGAVGNHGNGVGVTGLAGIYVILDTYTGGKVASSVTIGTNPTSGTAPKTLYNATSVPSLLGTHTVWVTVHNGVLTVAVDGTQVLQGAVTLPASVYPAFTAGTGATTDAQSVSGVTTMQY